MVRRGAAGFPSETSMCCMPTLTLHGIHLDCPDLYTNRLFRVDVEETAYDSNKDRLSKGKLLSSAATILKTIYDCYQV